jgi:RimJ/RimL family protein N-acetyltransferase
MTPAPTLPPPSHADGHATPVQRLHAADGRPLKLRAITPADLDRVRAFVESLSYGSRYFRFGRGDVHFDDAELVHVCDPDPRREEHLIVVTDEGMVIASARYVVHDDDDERCEFGLVIADAWQDQGLGQHLLQALIELAERRGLRLMDGEVLATNTRMLDCAQRAGFEPEAGSEGAPVRRIRRLLGTARA